MAEVVDFDRRVAANHGGELDDRPVGLCRRHLHGLARRQIVVYVD